jgi:hypothetical protein
LSFKQKCQELVVSLVLYKVCVREILTLSLQQKCQELVVSLVLLIKCVCKRSDSFDFVFVSLQC